MTESVPDEQALAEAYTSLRRGLLSAIRYRVGDAQVAQDLLQDVFVKAAKAIQEGRAPGNLGAWLHQVVRTTVIDYYRRARPDTESWDDERMAAQAPDDAQSEQDLALCMRPLVNALPPIYRQALWAADFEGRPLAALVPGVSVSAAKSRVSRGRSLLRERLLQCCDKSGAPQDSGSTGDCNC